MRSFRISAGTHSRAAARIGMLGGALLVLLWIGISALSPGGAATAAPALGHGHSPAQTPSPASDPAQPSDPTNYIIAPAASMTTTVDDQPDFCVPDAYEPDNSIEQATPLTMNGVAQVHGFHIDIDQDWYVVDGLTAGRWYNAATSHLVNGADTLMILYDVNRNELKNHDDVKKPCDLAHLQNCASSISWRATYTGPYYISVLTWIYPAGPSPSLCRGYDMTGRNVALLSAACGEGSNANDHPVADKHLHAHAIRDRQPKPDTYQDGYAHGHSHAYPDCHTHRDADAHCNEHTVADPHADADLHSDRDLDAAP